MAQHDFNIANATFPSVRSDINSVLEAINTSNSGTSRPSSAVAGTIWLDTTSATTPTLKFYDGTDDISLATIDYTANTVNWLDSSVTLTSPVEISGNSTAGAEIRLPEDTDNGSNYVGLKASDSIASNITFTLPNADGTADQVLKTDGSGNLSFTDVSGGTNWQSVKTSGFTAVASEGYACNTTSAAFTVTLPASASVGDTIAIVDYAGTFATNFVTLTSSLNIEGSTANKKLTTNREGVIITYVDATQGWVATSGVNSGDQAIDPIIYSADFLVIAGGGGGGGITGSNYGGGGGAGGYRTLTQNINSGTTYTITVGDGGAIYASGSNSSISGSGLTTITSAGGGNGGNTVAAAGGSGGGGSQGNGGGAGNTPSTSPSQGNNGGASGGANDYSNGGGGGASAVGADGAGNVSGSNGGAGGAGTASSITGTSVTRAGGGGGQSYNGTVGAGGAGGGGAGARSQSPISNAVAGTVNTGGGGGGRSNFVAAAAGGKGVVILSVLDANYSGTTTGSPTVATGVSGKTVLTFTGSGSYTG